jgi:hypothetical protein
MLAPFFNRDRCARRQAIDEEIRLAAEKVEQRRLGMILEERIRHAADENSNLPEGSILKIVYMTNNGGSFSVVVDLVDSVNPHGYTLMQFSIDLQNVGQELRISRKHGGERHWPRSEFETMSEYAAAMVRSFN